MELTKIVATDRLIHTSVIIKFLAEEFGIPLEDAGIKFFDWVSDRNALLFLTTPINGAIAQELSEAQTKTVLKMMIHDGFPADPLLAVSLDELPKILGFSLPNEMSIKSRKPSQNSQNDGDKELASLIKEKTLVDAKSVSVVLPHTTKNLDAIFQIMRQNWSSVDPKRLPKQINIAREIDAALGWGQKGDPSSEPSRNAKVIAMIIKPDNLQDTE